MMELRRLTCLGHSACRDKQGRARAGLAKAALSASGLQSRLPLPPYTELMCDGASTFQHQASRRHSSHNSNGSSA